MGTNKTQHTPGRWEVRTPLGEGHYAVLSESVNAGGNFYLAIVQPGGEGMPHASAKADAQLISAAPELLAACEAALNCPALGVDELELEDLAAIKKLRAAIAKATQQ